jgi:hypothetical protein
MDGKSGEHTETGQWETIKYNLEFNLLYGTISSKADIILARHSFQNGTGGSEPANRQIRKCGEPFMRP